MVIVIVLSACGSNMPLQLKFQEGDTRLLTIETKQYTTMKLMGMDMDTGQEQKLSYRFDVESVDTDGEATIKVTYDDIGIDMDLPMMEMMPVSPNDVFESLQGLEGKSFSVRLTPLGEVVDIKGVDDVLASIRDSQNAMMAQMPGGGDLIEGIVSEEAIRESIENVFGFYRAKPVAVGDTWTESTATKSGGMPFTSETTFTVTSREAGILTIATSTVVEPSSDTKTMGMMEVEFSIAGDGEGTVEVEEATGWIMSGKHTLDLKGDMSFSGGGAPGASSPMTVQVRSTVSSFPG